MLWLWKSREKVLALRFIHIQKTVHLQQLKGMQRSKQGVWKGYHLWHLSMEGIWKSTFSVTTLIVFTDFKIREHFNTCQFPTE